MSIMKKVLRVSVLAALVVSFLCQGCTIHFKGENVELDTVANHTYELEKVEVLGG